MKRLRKCAGEQDHHDNYVSESRFTAHPDFGVGIFIPHP